MHCKGYSIFFHIVVLYNLAFMINYKTTVLVGRRCYQNNLKLFFLKNRTLKHLPTIQNIYYNILNKCRYFNSGMFRRITAINEFEKFIQYTCVLDL